MTTTEAPPTDQAPLDVLLARWADLSALNSAAAVLGWDQETKLPPKGRPARGRALAALAGMAHEALCEPELAEAIDAVAADSDADDLARRHATLAARAVRRATAVPADLARALAATRSRAQASWQQARVEDDWARFAPDLAEIVSLTKQEADAYVAAGIAGTRYDALLDAYEPGATEAELAPLLAALRAELAPLVAHAAASGRHVDESVCTGGFDVVAQEDFARLVAGAIGYDFEAGRLDTSAHPFTSGFAPGDVRITWRPDPDDFRPGLFGVMHETGHGLYEQGLPAELADTPTGGAISLGVHESQSRLWENQVGRSDAFWRWAMEHFVARFPDSALAGLAPDARVETLWPALHTVRPSLIRVEADEITYNLHVVVRFELERALLADGLGVDDLPGAWDDTYDELLGVRSPSAADGVLQDIHWSMGAFGYFPTYTLGNLNAAQLFTTAGEQIGDLDEALAAGSFDVLLDWLRTNVHAHASRNEAGELIERATGAPLSAEPFLAMARAQVTAVYGP